LATLIGVAIFLILLLIVQITLGIKGRKWAWQRKRWKNIAHFNRVQRWWSLAALVILPPAFVATAGLEMYEGYRFQSGRMQLIDASVNAMTTAGYLGDYMQEHATIPATLEQAGLSADLPDQIGKLQINPASAEITVTMKKGDSAGKSFMLAPSFTKDGEIEWRCLAGQIEPSLHIPECRHNVAEKVSIFTTRLQGLAALHFAESVGKTMEQRMQLPDKVPDSLSDAGIEVHYPDEIKAIKLEPNGALRVTLNIAALQNQSFMLIPQLDQQKNIRWDCVNLDINYLLIPPTCHRAGEK
jgi:hypothetical protein